MKAYWIIIFCCYIPLIFAILATLKRQKITRQVIYKRIQKKKGCENEMLELINSFVGKLCVINSVDGNSSTGRIVEVKDNAVLLEDKKGIKTIVNVEYVTSIEELAEKKK